MPDFTVSALPSATPAADEMLRTVLEVALTPILLLRPHYAAEGGELADFGLDYLNPAALQMGGWPGQPGGTLQGHFPVSWTNGVFAFFRRVFETGEAGRHDFHYQAEGFDNYFEVAARRQGEQLVASFLDTASHSRTTVEAVLRESQAREQAARAEAERQRGELERVFEQAPIAIAVYRGPNYIIELANPTVARLWGRTQEQLIGKGLFEALPEVAGMGYEQLLDGVMATGVPHVAHAMEAQHDRNGHRETVYWDFVYVPMYEADGSVYGAMVVATEVTTQVLARQQMQQLNEELEMRVTARSAEARAAQYEAEQQREHARAQQALLGLILGQVPASIATLSGPEHRFSYFNEPYQTLVAGRAVLGQTVAEALPEVAEQGFISLLDQVYSTGQPFIGTETLALLHNPITGQDEQRYIDLLYQPLFDAQQQPQGILAFVLDVTDRVRARKQAETLQTAMMAVLKRQGQQRQDLYQIFEQAAPAIVLLREPNHRIEYFNPAFAELFPPEEWTGPLLGHTIAEVYPRIRMAGLVKLIDEVFNTGESQTVLDLPLAELQPGSPRYVTLAYQAYREDGRIVGVAAFAYDVTEQVRARLQLEDQQAELQRIFEQAPVPITILRGPEFNIELANEAVQAIWQRPAAQVMGRPYFEALPETAGQGFEQIFAEVIRTSKPHFVTEAPVQLPQLGTSETRQGYVNFAFQPLFDAQQQPTGIMAMGVEVTDQVRARQQVQALNEEMQATNRELHDTNQRLSRTNADLDTFVYTASHDLKAPIANIEGLLNALRHDLPTEVMQGRLVPRLLNLMEGSVARFQQTIGHLTDISQLQQPEATETVDLAALIRNVQLDLAPLIEAASASLTVQVTDCETVRVAPKTLRSVVYNLLSNAVKYRAPGRPAQVQLRAHCTAQQVVLEVQDNGLGLNETQQTQLFGMFRRLHTHVEGSGVGLFMVKRLIENAGGTIEVRSQPDAGTTFTVTLPA
ncbi:PAS domain-containing protein [Hymenobacter sp. DH14]|uniref:histidine kinase n=1 Tax=Hymenobacter cyanobacteriorum TaxID=2926463 RepID=A0A9X1VIQ5_9BACT|nr:PAS domain-containing sensor histidine kinase [Hymenobacter cyanobacteriorum]MCI1189002.1 PAS domain-containing protein [Hymenobacter cyanobacteriorum]